MSAARTFGPSSVRGILIRNPFRDVWNEIFFPFSWDLLLSAFISSSVLRPATPVGIKTAQHPGLRYRAIVFVTLSQFALHARYTTYHYLLFLFFL